MGKQVIKEGRKLIIHTRENYEDIDRVIITRKGSKEKAFYPYVNTEFNNMDEIGEWTICGYQIKDPLTLSLILRDKNIDEFNLRDFNSCFLEGYNRAVEDQNRAFEEYLKKVFEEGSNSVSSN